MSVARDVGLAIEISVKNIYDYLYDFKIKDSFIQVYLAKLHHQEKYMY
jgi:hypothetical protein